MHFENQLILQNLYSEYVNLPWYKKIFFPRKLLHALQDYNNDCKNIDKVLTVFNTFLEYVGFFQFWFFPFLRAFKDSFLIKSFQLISDNVLIEEEVNQVENIIQSSVEQSNLHLLNYMFESHPQDFLYIIQILKNANLLSKESGLFCFNILQNYPEINLEILKMLQSKNLLNNQINFFKVANHAFPFVLVDILYALDSIDLLTVVNINKIIEYKSLYPIGEVINKIILCLPEKRQELLDNLIAREDCLKSINTISDNLYDKLLADNSLAGEILTNISNHVKPYAIVNVLNMLTDLNLNFVNMLPIISENKFLLSFEEVIKRISIFTPERRQEILERLIEQEDFFKVVHNLLMYVDNVSGNDKGHIEYIVLNFAEKIINNFSVLINKPIEFAEAIMKFNDVDLLDSVIFEMLIRNSNPIEFAEAVIALNEGGLFHNADGKENLNILTKHVDSKGIVDALITMNKFELLDDANRKSLATCVNPRFVAEGLRLSAMGSLLNNDVKQIIFNAFLYHNEPLIITDTLYMLKNENLLDNNELNFIDIFKHVKPRDFLQTIISINNEKFFNDDNKRIYYDAVLTHPEPLLLYSCFIELHNTVILNADFIECNVNKIKNHLYPLLLLTTIQLLTSVGLFNGDNALDNFNNLIKHNNIEILVLILEHFDLKQFSGGFLHEFFELIITNPEPQLINNAIKIIYNYNLLKEDFGKENLRTILESNIQNPEDVAHGICILYKSILLNENNRTVLKEHSNPVSFARALVKLNEKGLLAGEQGERNREILLDSIEPEKEIDNIIKNIHRTNETIEINRTSSSNVAGLFASSVETVRAAAEDETKSEDSHPSHSL